MHAIAHVPPLHEAAPLFELHTLPQAPQLLAAVAVLVSQPFATFPSQLPHPGEHAIEQALPEHDGCPFVELHALPQAPQFCTSSVVCTSQPSPADWLQSA